MAKSVLIGALVGLVVLSFLFAILMGVSFDPSVRYVFVHTPNEITDGLDAAEYGASCGALLGAVVGALCGAIVRGFVAALGKPAPTVHCVKTPSPFATGRWSDEKG